MFNDFCIYQRKQLGCRGLQSQNTRQNVHYTRIPMLILHKFIINIVTCQNHFRLDWVLFSPRGLTLSALQQTKRAKKALYPKETVTYGTKLDIYWLQYEKSLSRSSLGDDHYNGAAVSRSKVCLMEGLS